jgi:hypothetical protein
VFSDSNSFLVIRLALTSVTGCLVFIFMEPLALECWNLFVEGPGLGSRNFCAPPPPVQDRRPTSGPRCAWSTLKRYGENVTCASPWTQFGLLPPKARLVWLGRQ